MGVACKAFDKGPQWRPPAFRHLGGAQVSGTASGAVRYTDTNDRRRPMMKGGLLWLIGIPLPIILILFFLGYLH
jgi:hypothetical protein